VRSPEVIREVELAYAEHRTIVPLLIDLTMEQLRLAHPIFETVFGTTTICRACSCDSCELATTIHESLDEPVIASRGPGTLTMHPLAGLPTFALSLGEPVYVETTCLACGGIGESASAQPGKWHKCQSCDGTGRRKFIKGGPRLDFRDL
jgi:hypothetical protein